MRKSKTIARTLLGLGVAGLSGGCGSSSSTEPVEPVTPPLIPTTPSDKTGGTDTPESTEPTEILFEPDDTWYDEEGNEVAQEWTTDPAGSIVPVTHPHDQLGRRWVYGPTLVLIPPPPILVRVAHVNGSTLYVHRVGGAGTRMVPLTRGRARHHGEPHSRCWQLSPDVMKQLTIVVKPFRAEAVLRVIAELGVTACAVREAKGYGRQKGYLDRYRGSEYSTAYLPKVEITVWVTDEQATELGEKLPRVARTGRIGDGKVFVVPLAWPGSLEF